MANVEELLRRYEQAKSRRQVWETHWQQLADLCWPDVGDFSSQRTPGQKRTQRIFDATQVFAAERFSAALEALMTPRTQRWHDLQATDEDLNEEPSVRQWFDEAVRILFAMRQRPRAGFYGAVHETYKNLGVFGTGSLFVDEDPEGGIRYHADQLSQIYIIVNDQGVVDTIFVEYKLTAHAAEQRFGIQNLPDRIQRQMKVEPYTEFDFVSVVMPRREDFERGRLGPRGMPFAAFEVALEDRKILEEGGFHEFPRMVPRYTKNACEDWGRSPAMLVLADIQTLQEQEKAFQRSGHLATQPPILLPDDGVIGAGMKTPRLDPNGLNYGAIDDSGRARMQAFQTNARLDVTIEMMEQKRASINDAFLISLFQILVERPNMTATEALLRAQEKGQLLGPTVGRLQADLLGPLIEREVNILFRQGAFPPLPPALLEAEGEYEITYDSPATRLQQLEQVTGFQQWVASMTPYIQLNPSFLDEWTEVEEVARGNAAILGVPGKWISTEEQRAKKVEAMRQAREQAEAQEQLPDTARAVKDLSSIETAANAG